jgi:hypothetical protein
MTKKCRAQREIFDKEKKNEKPPLRKRAEPKCFHNRIIWKVTFYKKKYNSEHRMISNPIIFHTFVDKEQK